MFRRFISYRKTSPQQSSPTVDTSRFNDSLADRTMWTMMNRGRTSFSTRSLVKASSSRYELKPTRTAMSFSLIFLALGMVFLLVTAYLATFMFDILMLIPLLLGFTFTTVGGFLYRTFNRPIVFDRNVGGVWTGKNPPSQPEARSTSKRFTYTDMVHAVQVISDIGSGLYYEVNLVLKDGRRINLLDHSDHTEIQSQARDIAALLNVPVWDAS